LVTTIIGLGRGVTGHSSAPKRASGQTLCGSVGSQKINPRPTLELQV